MKEKRKDVYSRIESSNQRELLFDQYKICYTKKSNSFFQVMLNEEGVVSPEDTLAVVTITEACSILLLLGIIFFLKHFSFRMISKGTL